MSLNFIDSNEHFSRFELFESARELKNQRGRREFELSATLSLGLGKLSCTITDSCAFKKFEFSSTLVLPCPGLANGLDRMTRQEHFNQYSQSSLTLIGMRHVMNHLYNGMD